MPHGDLLRDWLSKNYPDADNIDDIVQDSFLRTLKAREKGKIKSPKSFLFTTARNLVVGHLRSHKISRSVPLTNEGVSNVLEESESALEIVARKQEREIAMMAIDTLPPRCKEVFKMRKIQGLPQSEIAKRLGISENTVSAQLNIGLRKCTEFVEEYLQAERAGNGK